jgi:hypothetical protein
MNTSCLQYRLTDAERREFNETGLLILEDVLSPEQVTALTGATDQIFQRRLPRSRPVR